MSDSLKAGLKANAQKGEYKTIAIFYDVRTINPNTNEKTDAIAVFAEHINGNTAYDFYYPYKLIENKEICLSASFGNLTNKEVFEK